MKKTLLHALACLIFLQAGAQNTFTGKWFSFTRDFINEFDIASKEITISIVNWDLQPDASGPGYSSSQRIKYLIQEGNNAALGAGSKKGPVEISLLQLQREGRELVMYYSPFTSTDTAVIRAFIRTDTAKKTGMVFFSEAEINRMKNLQLIEKMTTADFNHYAACLKERWQADDVFQDPDQRQQAVSFSMRYCLFTNGYNPLVETYRLNGMLRRFMNDPETKDSFKNAGIEGKMGH